MDRLSDLPDSLICHILSFLPTKFSAATSVLSKRWRYLWTDVPVLDLDNRYHESINYFEFSYIIYTVLMRLNHDNLHTFRLTATCFPHNDFMDYQIETWISIVAPHRLRNLHIGLGDIDCCIRLPECLFTFKNLVQLSLHECSLRSSTVRLPALKKLHLVDVLFHGKESFSYLISSCPMLEELVVDRTADFCPWKRYCIQFRYRVSSPTIKSIKIVCTKESEKDIEDFRHPYTLDIDTPALKYLKIENCLPKYISGPTRTSLVEADIKLTVSEDKEEGETFTSSSVLEFVDNLYNVESLSLRLSAGDFTEVTDAPFATSTVWFHNLKKLELAANWRFLLKFLEYAPNLRVLVIPKIDKHLKYWEEPQQLHQCLTSHLTTIIIQEFEGTAQDFEMVRYFLSNAKILETMNIYFRADSFDYNQNRDARKRISLFERGSVACKLRFGQDFVESSIPTYKTWCPDLNVTCSGFPWCCGNFGDLGI